MPKRVSVVLIGNLSKSIDRAVALAGKRHNVELSGENVIRNWEILGRRLSERFAHEVNPLEVAQTIAKEAGLKGTPVATKIGRDILVGVIPREFDIRF